MAYTPLDATKPTTAQTRQAIVDSARTNLAALRDALAATGAVQGFAYSNNANGTSIPYDKPTEVYFRRGTEWIKVVLTWGSSGGADGNVTKAAYYYSSNSGGAYDGMADASGNYVLNLSYESGGSVTAGTWNATP